MNFSYQSQRTLKTHRMEAALKEEDAGNCPRLHWLLCDSHCKSFPYTKASSNGSQGTFLKYEYFWNYVERVE